RRRRVHRLRLQDPPHERLDAIRQLLRLGRLPLLVRADRRRRPDRGRGLRAEPGGRRRAGRRAAQVVDDHGRGERDDRRPRGARAVARASACGPRRFDTHSALKLMLKSALTPGVKDNQYEMRPGLADYLSKGYIPGDSPSTLLEDASSDFAISSFARALGD